MVNIKIVQKQILGKTVLIDCFVNGFFYCNGIQNPKYPILSGVYKAFVDKVGKNGLSIQLIDVLNHTAIELHIANYYSQLRGCTALGYGYKGEMLLNSTLAMQNLIKGIGSDTSIYVELCNHLTDKQLNKDNIG